MRAGDGRAPGRDSSAAALPAEPREFVVYESALSDILRALVFYAWLNANGAVNR